MNELTLMKGMSRANAEQNGLPTPNNMGLIFATTDLNVAMKYSEGWGDGESEYILKFNISADATLADLNDEDTVRAVGEYIADYGMNVGWQGDDLSEPEYFELFVEQMMGRVQGHFDSTYEAGFADMPGAAEALLNMGYAGYKQGENYCLFDADLLIALPEGERYA